MNPPMPPQSEVAARVGVVLYDKTVSVDAVLATAVAGIRARGISVGGLLQRAGELLPNGKHRIWVDDIVTGDSIRLDRPRGSGAKDCILDPDALARAVCIVRRATEAGHRVIVINRFGYAETEGGGMRAELAEAICAGAMVLIAVRFTRLADLEGFLGGPATVLPASVEAVMGWVERAAVIRQPAAAVV